MNISYAWLKDYVELGDISPEALAQKLTFAGLEVESVTPLAKGLEKVVVGQILERNKHPNADKLSLTKIDVGTGTPLEIVCGAQNIKAGQKIPVAMIGGTIPNGLTIKAAKIRDVASSGMLCSLDELLLPKEWQAEDGIFLLRENAKVGMPFAEYLGRNDYILEIGVTPNRGDALSHVGVARDVAALLEKNLKTPEVKLAEKTGSKFSAQILNSAGKDLCPRYFGRVIEGVKIGPSPEWLRKKIEAIGLRSINNVVDVTSFVMMEIGQPLHAFDAGKIDLGGKIKIEVRTANDGEKFETLAKEKVELKKGDLVIANEANAIALAGVIGGLNSEVDDKTTNIFLESAEFHPVSVRKTGRRLGILTDAGYRFERGVDPAKVKWAMDRASALIAEIAGGTVYQAVSSEGSEKLEPQTQIRLRLSDMQRTLGKVPDQQKVIHILRSLGIAAEAAAGEKDVIATIIPYWRRDIKKPVDLMEEVIRIWGFENLQAVLPLGGVGEQEAAESKRRSYFQLRRIRRHLASLGFYEALNYGFTSPEVLAKIFSPAELGNLVEVTNPVTSDYSVMNPSLLPGLLQNLNHNFSHKINDLRLFEARRIFHKSINPIADKKLDTGVDEENHLAMVITGAEVDEFWQGKPVPVDFYSLKGALESTFEMLSIKGIQYHPGADRSYLHPGQSATLMIGNKTIGVAGRLHPGVEKKFSFEQDVFYAELRLDLLLNDRAQGFHFKDFSNFPEVERDFSCVVKENVNAQMIRALVTKIAKPLLKDFHFFDVYKGSRVPEGHLSYAFRIQLGANDHTLTDAEISSTQEKIMKELEKEFQAKFAGLS